MRFILIGLIFLLLPLFSFASDGCLINESCSWYAYGTTGELGVNISFTYPNGSNTASYPMINNSGIYIYNKSFNEEGNVLGCASAYNSTNIINTACESKFIGISSEKYQVFTIAQILFQNNMGLIFGLFVIFLLLFSLFKR